ncbi:M3 family oligoendopeptidase [candidate division WOR-3 bacterium]|nr:M3 family oligoendopeptidase [candidate division WOR-3 bacterium]
MREEELKAKGVKWDLSCFYSSAKDSAIQKTIKDAEKRTDDFVKKFKTKIESKTLTAGFLKEAVETYEGLYNTILKPMFYSSLLFAGDCLNQEYQDFYQRMQTILANFSAKTTFFELEITGIQDGLFKKLLKDDSLSSYRHWLEKVRVFKPYLLSEKEEQVIIKKDLAGKEAFVRLFDEYTSSFSFDLEVAGKKKTLTGPEIRSLFQSPDRKTRKKAVMIYYAKYKENSLVLKAILNDIIKDHSIDCEMRKYPDPILPTHLSNEVTREIIDTMMDVVQKNYGIVKEYYKVKAKLLKLNKLAGYDLRAPVGKTPKRRTWGEAKKMIIETFSSFDKEFGESARLFFDKKWIDAEVRKGKRGGAFCAGTSPDLHPFILASYMGNMSDIYTVTHELGHGIHDLFAGREQSLLNYHPPLVMAETASVFAEMILTDRLLKELTSKDEKIFVLTHSLEDIFGTAFRQTMYTLFELDIHKMGKEKQMSANEFSKLWIKRRDEMYGDSVDFTEEQEYFWSIVPHFIHTRFYCYAYSFAELFVLALYQEYRKGRSAFIPKYKNLLFKGGSDKVTDVAKELGFDITRRDFWQGGFDFISSLLNELKGIV